VTGGAISPVAVNNDLLAGRDALPVHAEHRRRQSGQRRHRLQHVGCRGAQLPQHRLRGTPRGRPAQYASADRGLPRERSRLADPLRCPAPCDAGATTRR
jgi:hypothetical protein